MSRIGKLPIIVPAGVTVTVVDNLVTVKGPLGTLEKNIDKNIEIKQENNILNVTRNSDVKEIRSLHGLSRSLIANMVQGVVKQYEIPMIINGVGFKASKDGRDLILNIGYSHPVRFTPPQGVEVDIVSLTEIVVKGIDKEAVGQSAANIKSFRVPDPYHLYGIRYKDEIINKKEGKKGK